MAKKPILVVTGELLTKGKDWSNLDFRILYQRLTSEVEHTPLLSRYIRYHGNNTEGETRIRFFGVQPNSLQNIPPGMIAFELSEENFSVYKPGPTGPVLTWRSGLVWEWLDTSNPGFPVGEFSTLVPETWVTTLKNQKIKFIVSGNAYAGQGVFASDDVELVPYDDSWPQKFLEMEKYCLGKVPRDIGIRYEHYGSTAIPGMPSKPIIDILMEISSFEEARKYMLPLFNKPECEYWWYHDHMLFIIRNQFLGIRTHHIHAASRNHHIWDGVAFRDYLRSHPDIASKYAKLKKRLVKANARNREKYTDAKASFVDDVTEKAKSELVNSGV